MRAVVTIVVLVACARHREQVDKKEVDPWSTVAIGSVFETKTVTHMDRPFVHDTITTTKQTLVGRTDAEAAVRLEMTTDGSDPVATEIKIPLGQRTKPCPEAAVTTANEKCIVPAGLIDCTKTSVELRQGDVIKSTVTWTAARIPVPVKSVVKNENMTTVTELTAMAPGKL